MIDNSLPIKSFALISLFTFHFAATQNDISALTFRSFSSSMRVG